MIILTFILYFIEAAQLKILKYENVFIDLGRALVNSVKIGQFNYRVCIICIGEMETMIKNRTLTALMLKKNPEIVNWIAKLCHFTDTSHGQANVSEECQQIRDESKRAFDAFKELMDFDGSNDAFLEFFYENVKLFHELTTNITNSEKRQLTIDPELNLMMSINDA